MFLSSGRLLGRFEELGTKRQKSSAPAIGEKTEVSDANEARWEQVEQEPAQELIYGERHEALLIAVRGVPPTECDFVIRRVKGVKKIVVRLGNWLTGEQAHALWQA